MLLRREKLKMDDKTFEQMNDFENICKSKKEGVNLNGFLKVTTDGHSDVYDDDGNRLSYKNKQEYVDELCSRA